MDRAYELNSYNMHRLVLTGVMVAAKFVDDFYFSNNYWSKVPGPILYLLLQAACRRRASPLACRLSRLRLSRLLAAHCPLLSMLSASCRELL